MTEDLPELPDFELDVEDWEEDIVEKPDIQYEDIGGLDDVLEKLMYFKYGINFPELYIRFASTPPKGLLMYGPPGCGKTMIAKAMANELDCYFMEMPMTRVISKWIGNAEKNVHELLKKAKKRYLKTGIKVMVFVDEAEQMFQKRGQDHHGVLDRVVNEWLRNMDGIDDEGAEGIIYVAATNHIDKIDDAIKRAGRFDYKVKISPPNKRGALDILMKQMAYRQKGVQRVLYTIWDEEELIDKIYKRGMTGADIDGILRLATDIHIRQLIEHPNSANSLSQVIHQQEIERAALEYNMTGRKKKKSHWF